MAISTQTFELNLWDTTRTGQLILVLLLGIVGLMVLMARVAALLPHGWPSNTGGLAVLGGGGYLGWRAYRRAAVIPVSVTITPTELRLEDLRSDGQLTQTVRFADLVAYRCSLYEQDKTLRLTQRDAPVLKLRTPGIFAKSGDFVGMVVAFEQAAAAAPNANGAQVHREKSFFEKPISTYLLVLVTLLLGAMGLSILQGKRPMQGSLISAVGVYVTYAAAWWVAAKRRNQA